MDDLTGLPPVCLEDRVRATNQTIENLRAHVERQQALIWMHQREIERVVAELARREKARKTGTSDINASKGT